MSKMSRVFGRSMTKLFNKGLSDQTFHCVGHSFGKLDYGKNILNQRVDLRWQGMKLDFFGNNSNPQYLIIS